MSDIESESTLVSRFGVCFHIQGWSDGVQGVRNRSTIRISSMSGQMTANEEFRTEIVIGVRRPAQTYPFCGTISHFSTVITRVSQSPNPQVAALIVLVYDELRRVAAGYLRRERSGQTLQATALVNEAFIRLASERRREFAGRTHFVAIAALSMRQILVERARARQALKRGQRPERVMLDERLLTERSQTIDVIALDEAMRRLGAVDAQLMHIVELRYFGGLTFEETAEVIGVSVATVKRHWTLARAWLKRALGAGDVEPA